MIVNRYKNMLYISDSKIAGKGLFTDAPIESKNIIAVPENALFTDDYNSIEYKQTAVRYCLNYYIHGDIISNEDYLNHSDDPNCIYFCGILFSLRDIAKDEELTIDYKLLVSEDDKEDWLKGKLNGEQSFISSLKLMNNLFGVN